MTNEHIFCILGYVITGLIILALIYNSRGKTKKYKRFLWGITIIFPISFILSITAGLHYSIVKQQNLGMVLTIYVFPIIVFIGLIYIFSGIAIVLDERGRRKYRDKSNNKRNV